MTTLVNGRILANTECPFRSQCRFVEEGLCHHKGVNHDTAFSCGAARWFDLVERSKEVKEKLQ